MRVYKFRNNTSFERKWTAAVAIHPRSQVVRWHCPDCGCAAEYPAGAFDVTIEDGKAFPDILLCGAYPLLIVSGRVLASWESNRIGPFTAYPVSVSEAISTKLRPDDAPKYFRVEVHGTVNVDMVASDAKITKFCFRCGRFMTDPIVKKLVFFEQSWDGSHVFRDTQFFPRVIFCTEVVKQLAEAEGHTNFRFDEMPQTERSQD